MFGGLLRKVKSAYTAYLGAMDPAAGVPATEGPGIRGRVLCVLQCGANAAERNASSAAAASAAAAAAYAYARTEVYAEGKHPKGATGLLQSSFHCWEPRAR